MGLVAPGVLGADLNCSESAQRSASSPTRSFDDVRRTAALTLEADLPGLRRDVSQVPLTDICSAANDAHVSSFK
jgi:hypothetical protein